MTYISYPGYAVTKNEKEAEKNFNNIIENASMKTGGGRKSSTRKRR